MLSILYKLVKSAGSSVYFVNCLLHYQKIVNSLSEKWWSSPTVWESEQRRTVGYSAEFEGFSNVRILWYDLKEISLGMSRGRKCMWSCYAITCLSLSDSPEVQPSRCLSFVLRRAFNKYSQARDVMDRLGTRETERRKAFPWPDRLLVVGCRIRCQMNGNGRVRNKKRLEFLFANKSKGIWRKGDRSEFKSRF